MNPHLHESTLTVQLDGKATYQEGAQTPLVLTPRLHVDRVEVDVRLGHGSGLDQERLEEVLDLSIGEPQPLAVSEYVLRVAWVGVVTAAARGALSDPDSLPSECCVVCDGRTVCACKVEMPCGTCCAKSCGTCGR